MEGVRNISTSPLPIARRAKAITPPCIGAVPCQLPRPRSHFLRDRADQARLWPDQYVFRPRYLTLCPWCFDGEWAQRPTARSIRRSAHLDDWPGDLVTGHDRSRTSPKCGCSSWSCGLSWESEKALNFPAMNRSVADWMPPRLAGRTVGVMLLGVPAALLLGGPILANLIEDIDWRNAFLVLAIGSGLIGVAIPIVYRRPAQTEIDPNPHCVSWWTLIRNPTLLATSWSFFAFGYVLWFGITWIPGYFEQVWHMDLASIGWFSTLPWGLACLFIPLIGWYSDSRMERTGRIRASRVHPIWIFQLLGALCFVPLIFMHSQMMAITNALTRHWVLHGRQCSVLLHLHRSIQTERCSRDRHHGYLLLDFWTHHPSSHGLVDR